MKRPDLSAEQATYFFLLLGATLPVVSIAVSQIFLALAIAGFAWEKYSSGSFRFFFPPIKAPLLLFMGYTFISLLFSPEPGIGRAPVNKFWLFVLIPLVANLYNLERVFQTYSMLFFLGILSSVLTIAQYLIVSRISVETRLTGFMGHWMTLSGELMLVFIALTGFILFGKPEKVPIWLAGVGLIGVALSLTLTRSVWIATIGGALVLLLMKHFHWKTLAFTALSFTLILLLAPDFIRKRIESVWNPNEPSNYARIAIWKAGFRMVQAHPWFGVGPQRISRVFYEYHPYPEDRKRSGFYPVHMHNNLLQFAAERGIPCAVFWLWLMFKLAVDHWKGYRQTSQDQKEKAVFAIGFTAVLALFLAGFFEFNFGDSEVLMIFLFLVSAPYAVGRVPERTQPGIRD